MRKSWLALIASLSAFSSLMIFGLGNLQASPSTQLEQLNQELKQFDLANPGQDAKRNALSCRTQFLELLGFASYAPGVAGKEGSAYLNRYGTRIIEGTGDMTEGPIHEAQMQKAKQYAEAYNVTLFKIFKAREAGGQSVCEPGIYSDSNLDQIKKISDQEALKLGYDIKNMGVRLDSENSQWKNYLSSIKAMPDQAVKISGKDFIAVHYSPIPAPNAAILGGDLWVFVDRASMTVLTILRGK